jgi:hypothetical protein
MGESWSEYDSTPPRERVRRGPDPLEQGFDRLVSAGRQLVDGVSGARPGSRTAPRGVQRGGEDRRPGLDRLGRWVEDKIDWILDEDEDWREPWQEPAPRQSVPREPVQRDNVRQVEPAGRRPLEAISRRGRAGDAGAGQDGEAAQASGAEDWPDDASFSIPRWQRQPAAPQPLPVDAPDPQSSGAGRPLPRSTRRRRA